HPVPGGLPAEEARGLPAGGGDDLAAAPQRRLPRSPPPSRHARGGRRAPRGGGSGLPLGGGSGGQLGAGSGSTASGPASDLALFFVRLRATRWYRRNCDALPAKEVTTPAVLPAVPYRGVRRRQRRGAEPSGQRILTRKGGDRSVRRDRDCQHRGGWGPGARVMANPGETVQASVKKTGQRG